MEEKLLITIKDICKLTGWGETKVREIVKRDTSDFTVYLGNRIYINKKKFIEYLEKCAKYNIKI